MLLSKFRILERIISLELQQFSGRYGGSMDKTPFATDKAFPDLDTIILLTPNQRQTASLLLTKADSSRSTWIKQWYVHLRPRSQAVLSSIISYHKYDVIVSRDGQRWSKINPKYEGINCGPLVRLWNSNRYEFQSLTWKLRIIIWQLTFENLRYH